MSIVILSEAKNLQSFEPFDRKTNDQRCFASLNITGEQANAAFRSEPVTVQLDFPGESSFNNPALILIKY